MIELSMLVGFGFLPNFLYALTSLGSTIVFQILWQIAYLSGFTLAKDLVLGIVMIQISLFFTSLPLLCWLWPNVYVRVAALLGIPGALSDLIGAHVLLTVDETWIRRALGVLLICTFILLILRKRFIRRESSSSDMTVEYLLTSTGMLQMFCFSVIDGISNGIFGISGPPFMIWAILNDVPKDIVRANICAADVIALPVNVVYLLVVGKQFRSGDVTYYLVFLGSSIVGLVLGNSVAKRVSQKHFQVIITYLILPGGGLFISTNLNPKYLKLVVLFICVCVGVVFDKLSQIGKRERLSQGVSEYYFDTDKEPKISLKKNTYVYTTIDGVDDELNLMENERVKYGIIVQSNNN